jgi:hypothetical protein
VEKNMEKINSLTILCSELKLCEDFRTGRKRMGNKEMARQDQEKKEKMINFRHDCSGGGRHRFTIFFNCVVQHIHCLEQACPKLPQRL